MAIRTTVTDAAIIAAVEAVASNAHYGFAPDLAAPAAIVATLAVRGLGTAKETSARIVLRLAELASAGVIRGVPVIGPDGCSSEHWFGPVSPLSVAAPLTLDPPKAKRRKESVNMGKRAATRRVVQTGH